VTANTIGVTGLTHSRLPARLTSLQELTKIGSGRSGPDGFSQELLTEAEALLRRSGERMRMSASHTVVALAGGTGSGKSSLFNALAGANFSPAGVTRPTTKHSHACVWGMEGAAPLLDWLGVQRRHRYARASALDEGEALLTGMLLLDLPDHDSVVTGSAALVDRLVKLTDMLVWVLDPLKYADASVHRRYLVPLAGHAAVTTVVLNQIDTLTPDQAADCESDLRRLLDSEGLTETQVLVTSATTGAGLSELRRVLAAAVAVRQAATDRITADVDALLEKFAVYAGDSVPGWLPPASPESAFAMAASADVIPSGPVPDPASARPPWELADGDEYDGNGRVGAADWQPWQTTAAPTRPVSSARPPWEDATPDGSGEDQPAEDPAIYVPAGPVGTLTAAFAKAAGAAAAKERIVAATGDDTVRSIVFDISRRNVWPAPFTGRCLRNKHLEQWYGREVDLMQHVEEESGRYAAARSTGNFDIAAVIAGESLGLVHDVPNAQAVIERTVAEAVERLARSWAVA